ncbi:MAG TPA: hypothetical protein VFS30_06020 [Dehalococcoidia bacterium]|nr:hypothetical protein [Dehalococcoidia bacterium]
MKTLVAFLAFSMAVTLACGGGSSGASGGSGGGGGSGGSNSSGALGTSSGDARSEGCKTPAETAGFNGQLVLVCGTVVEAVYVAEQNRTTYIYFGAAPPDQDFTAFITANSRSGFNPFPENQFTAGINVCIEGKVELDGDGKPMIDVQSALNMLIIQSLEIHGEHCAGN